jgi:hypothetical protein
VFVIPRVRSGGFELSAVGVCSRSGTLPLSAAPLHQSPEEFVFCAAANMMCCLCTVGPGRTGARQGRRIASLPTGNADRKDNCGADGAPQEHHRRITDDFAAPAPAISVVPHSHRIASQPFPSVAWLPGGLKVLTPSMRSSLEP